MRKSGLQKQISSIFNETSVPEPDVTTATLPTQQDAVDTTSPEVPPISSSDSVHAAGSKPSLAQRMAAVTTASEAVHTPAVPAMRPKPLTKTPVKTLKPKGAGDVTGQIKKALLGSSAAKMDPRQKKMTIMVGVLSVVFAAVLFVSLGGLGQSSKATTDEPSSAGTSAAVQSENSLQWRSPQPMPEQLRNPMDPVTSKVVSEQSSTGSDQVVVKGIVFSKTRPTAIINDKILAQGESIGGLTVVKISKESVEFEKDGQRWTQPVQR